MSALLQEHNIDVQSDRDSISIVDDNARVSAAGRMKATQSCDALISAAIVPLDRERRDRWSRLKSTQMSMSSRGNTSRGSSSLGKNRSFTTTLGAPRSILKGTHPQRIPPPKTRSAPLERPFLSDSVLQVPQRASSPTEVTGRKRQPLLLPQSTRTETTFNAAWSKSDSALIPNRNLLPNEVIAVDNEELSLPSVDPFETFSKPGLKNPPRLPKRRQSIEKTLKIDPALFSLNEPIQPSTSSQKIEPNRLRQQLHDLACAPVPRHNSGGGGGSGGKSAFRSAALENAMASQKVINFNSNSNTSVRACSPPDT